MRGVPVFLLLTCVSGCASQAGWSVQDAHDFRVLGFKSDDEMTCRRSDVNITNQSAQAFFHRAQQVEYSVVHDQFDIAPCEMYGTVGYRHQTCHWTINAGGVAWISCSADPGKLDYVFGCENCRDLLSPSVAKPTD